MVLALAVVSVALARVGEVFENVETAAGSIQDATVIASTASTVTFRHAGGLVQLPLRSLSTELQAQLGYDPEKALAHEREIAVAVELQRVLSMHRAKLELEARMRRRSSPPLNRVLGHLGQPARIGWADLRTDFNSLNLGAQNQGQRPSCAVYAVVGALEYEHSKTVGRVEKFSEDYLIWATRQVSGRRVQQGQSGADTALARLFDDIGFTLDEVLAGLRAYGVPTAAEMPNSNGRRMSQIEEPNQSLIANALGNRRIAYTELSGATMELRVDSIIHALNEGVPVVAGFFWPARADNRMGAISARDRPTRFLHAVTIVGYTSENASRDSVRFTFRNSWGRSWGDDGYGTIDIGYLQRSLAAAVILQVQGAQR